MTLNSFVTDSEAEIAFVKQFCEERGCEFAISEVWEKGGEGGIALAEKVLKTLEEKESHFEPLYPSELPLTEKIETVAKEIYGAKGVNYTAAAKKQLAKLTELGFGDLPVCMAKTQYSLSDDPALLGRPKDFDITCPGSLCIRRRRLCGRADRRGHDNARASETAGGVRNRCG